MKKWFGFILFLVILLIGIYLVIPYYNLYQIKDQNSLLFEKDSKSLVIENDVPFSALSSFLVEKDIIATSKDIEKLIQYKNYHKDTLKKGKYLLRKSWTNNELVNQLFLMRNQNIIDLHVPSVIDLNSLADKISKQIFIDSSTLIELFNNSEVQKDLGFNSNTFPTFFMPNTYEIYATIKKEEFIDLMAKAYREFWNTNRKAKAKQLGLSQSEVTILASIVQMEQQVRIKEHSRIAGLYINRLNSGMKLQADPTVKFAINKQKLKRVLNKHLKYDSPYNTYMYAGLPPGPICIPEITTIDAVLNYEKHNYIYMCAEPTYSGNHNFAVTYNDHLRNYKLYKAWLDKEGIR